MTEEKIPVGCPGCNKRLGVPVTAVGKTVRCPGCRTAVRVPLPIPEPAVPEPTGRAPGSVEPVRALASQTDPQADLPAEPSEPPQPFCQLVAEYRTTFASVAGPWFAAGFFIVMSLALALFTMMFSNTSTSKNPSWVMPLVWLLCAGGFLFGCWNIARISAASKQRVQLFPEGIIIRREGRPVRYRWDEIKSVASKETDVSGTAMQFGLAGILVYWATAGREFEVTIKFKGDEPVVLNALLPEVDRIAAWVKLNLARKSRTRPEVADEPGGNPFENLF